jgi:hypothetical protein
MKSSIGLLAALVLVSAGAACRPSPTSNSTPVASSSATTTASSAEVKTVGTQTIDATGYVIRLSNGTIALDVPTLEPSGQGSHEFSHYELTPNSEVAKVLDKALERTKAIEFPFLMQFKFGAPVDDVPINHLLFSTKYCESTRYSPVIATVKARLQRVEKQEPAQWKFGGTTYHVEPIRVVAFQQPFEMMEMAQHYRKSLRQASAEMRWVHDARALDLALVHIDAARDALSHTLGEGAPAYEAFRFIDGLSKDLKKGATSMDPIDFGAALRRHIYSYEDQMESAERPVFLDEERELVTYVNAWIHEQLAKAFYAEKDAARARELGALIIKADELRLGPKMFDPPTPRVRSDASMSVSRRFPDLDPGARN